MSSFAFVTTTQAPSCKVASPQTRKMIRAHVMKHHWSSKSKTSPGAHGSKASNPSASRQLNNPPALAEVEVDTVSPTDAPTEIERSLEDDTEQDLFPKADTPSLWGKDMTSHLLSSSTASSTSSASSESGLGLSRYLTRATDAFVYAGSSIDITSYGFFHHYSSEFHVVLCDPIQPLSMRKTNQCCSSAIQENSAALLHAICFTAAIHEAFSRTAPRRPLTSFNYADVDSFILTQALPHKVASLSLLKADILVSEATILCVTVLLAAEAVAGDHAPLAVHTAGLHRMINIFGGEHVLSPVVATHVHLADIKSAEVLQTNPLPWRRHFNTLYSKSFRPNSTLGSLFLSPSVSTLISSKLWQCLMYARHLISTLEQHHSGQHCLEHDLIVIDDYLLLEHRLLSVSESNGLAECIRIALLLYSNTTLWSTPPWFGWVRSLLEQLRTSLQSLDWPSAILNHPELILWIVFVGRQAAIGPESQTAWWSARLRPVASVLGVTTWEEAREHLQGFFYVDRLCLKSWRAVWETDVQGLGSHDEIAMSSPCNHQH